MGLFEHTIDDLPELRRQLRQFASAEPYRSFHDLTAAEQEGQSWSRTAIFRKSRLCIVAPHGGNIEPGTSELAKLLAGNAHSLYLFESHKPVGDWSLHISSTRFDDPVCLEMLRAHDTVVTIHGCLDEAAAVFVGGRARHEKTLLISQLRQQGFAAFRDRLHRGLEKTNICNGGLKSAGLQLEFTAGIRRWFSCEPALADFGASQNSQKLVQVLSHSLSLLC